MGIRARNDTSFRSQPILLAIGYYHHRASHQGIESVIREYDVRGMVFVSGWSEHYVQQVTNGVEKKEEEAK
jgi:hypothetical protein